MISTWTIVNLQKAAQNSPLQTGILNPGLLTLTLRTGGARDSVHPEIQVPHIENCRQTSSESALFWITLFYNHRISKGQIFPNYELEHWIVGSNVTKSHMFRPPTLIGSCLPRDCACISIVAIT